MEDHEDSRAFLSLFLRGLGANVVMASNAFEGIEAVKNNRPNLVLSDISMPDRDGFALLRDIRVFIFGPDAGGSVPVIAMTALISHRDRARVLDTGFPGMLAQALHCTTVTRIDFDCARRLGGRFEYWLRQQSVFIPV